MPLLLPFSQVTGTVSVAFDNALPLTLAAYGQVNPGLAQVVPAVKGAVMTTFTNAGTGPLSIVLPADLFPGQEILLTIIGPSIGTMTQTAGVTLSILNTPQIEGSRGSVLLGGIARAPATPNAGISQDAGTTITFTSTTTNKSWAILGQCITRGYQTVSIAFGDRAQQTSGVGQTSLALAGSIPGAPYTKTFDVYCFVTDASNVTNAFPSTVAITGGGTDALVGSVTSAATASQQGVGIAMYQSTVTNTPAVQVATRTLTFASSPQASSIHGYSITVRPMRGLPGDVAYGEDYVSTPDGIRVFDLFWPTAKDPTLGVLAPCKTVMSPHGGIIGGDRFIDLTKIAAPQAAQARGAAVCCMEWRQPQASVRGGKEAGYDLHAVWRWMIANATHYGLDPALILWHGGSGGGADTVITTETMNDSSYYGPSPENAGVTEVLVRRMVVFPGSNNRWIDQWKTDKGIANPLPFCASGSDLGLAYSDDGIWVDACHLNAWDVTAYPKSGATQDATATLPANARDAAYWAKYGSCTAPLRIMHGLNDITIPPEMTKWDGSGGRPLGLWDSYKANRPSLELYLNMVTGGQHGGNHWLDGTDGAALDPALMTAAYDWLIYGTTVGGATFDNPLPLTLTATGTSSNPSVHATFDNPLPLTLSAVGSVTNQAYFNNALPLTLTATGQAGSQPTVTGTFNNPLPLVLTATGHVTLQVYFDNALPLTFTATVTIAQIAGSLRLTAARTTRRTAFTQIYDFILDLSIDFDPDVDVEQQNSTTGVYGTFSGLMGVQMLLSDERGSAVALDATLIKAVVERIGLPGRVHPVTPFDTDDLRRVIDPLALRVAYLNLFKAGELYYEPFRCLVRRDRLGA